MFTRIISPLTAISLRSKNSLRPCMKNSCNTLMIIIPDSFGIPCQRQFRSFGKNTFHGFKVKYLYFFVLFLGIVVFFGILLANWAWLYFKLWINSLFKFVVCLDDDDHYVSSIRIIFFIWNNFLGMLVGAKTDPVS